MNNKKLLIILALGILIIVSILVYFSNNKAEKSAPAEEPKKEALFYDDINLESIYPDGDELAYSLRNGEVFQGENKLNENKDKEKIEKVLRLALFSQWMKEDPLLFSATADADKIGESIELLAKGQKEFLEKNGWQENIFATDFLQSFVDSSKQYEIFKNKISIGNAFQLIESIEKTNSLYALDAENLKKVFSSIGSDLMHVGLSGDTYTTFGIMVDDLDKIAENQKLMAEE